MLDYDGTLAPFADDRMQAALYPCVAERLVELRQLAETRLVFVSGRPARELPLLLPANLDAEIWGSHGREQLLPNGVYKFLPPTVEQTQALVSFERMLSEAGYETAIEKKLGSLAIHSRGLAESRARELKTLAEGLFAKVVSDSQSPVSLEWLPFDGGVEVRGSDCSKATAIKQILDDESGEVVVAYLGDDETDEDAFRALAGRGLRVLVRGEPRVTLADLWIRPPAELLAFLDRWLATISIHRNNAKREESNS